MTDHLTAAMTILRSLLSLAVASSFGVLVGCAICAAAFVAFVRRVAS